jgi:hypothetical protein
LQVLALVFRSIIAPMKPVTIKIIIAIKGENSGIVGVAEGSARRKAVLGLTVGLEGAFVGLDV